MNRIGIIGAMEEEVAILKENMQIEKKTDRRKRNVKTENST